MNEPNEKEKARLKLTDEEVARIKKVVEWLKRQPLWVVILVSLLGVYVAFSEYRLEKIEQAPPNAQWK